MAKMANLCYMHFIRPPLPKKAAADKCYVGLWIVLPPVLDEHSLRRVRGAAEAFK